MLWKFTLVAVAASALLALPVPAADTTTSVSKDSATGHETVLVDDGKTLEFRTGGPSHIYTAILIDVDGDGKVSPYVDTEYGGSSGQPCPSYQLASAGNATSFCGTLKTRGIYSDETVGAVRITRWKIPYVELTMNRQTVAYRLRFWNNQTKTYRETTGVYRLTAPFPSAIVTKYQAEIVACESLDRQQAAKALAGCSAVIDSGLADPTERAILYRRRGSLKAAAKDYAGALADYDKSIAAASTAVQRGLTEAYRSDVYAATNRAADQAAELDRALISYPGSPGARIARGEIRENAGRHKEALADYEQARWVAPNYPFLLNALCWSRAANLNIELVKARKDCDEAIRLAPDESAYRDSRGMVGLRESAWRAAFDDYTAAIGLDPQDASAWFGRGIAASRLQMKDRAASDLAKARALSRTIEADYAKRGLVP